MRTRRIPAAARLLPLTLLSIDAINGCEDLDALVALVGEKPAGTRADGQNGDGAHPAFYREQHRCRRAAGQQGIFSLPTSPPDRAHRVDPRTGRGAVGRR